MSIPSTPEGFRAFEAGLPMGSLVDELLDDVDLIRSFASEEWTEGSARDGFGERLGDVLFGGVPTTDPPVDPELVERLTSRLLDHIHGNPDAFDTLVDALGGGDDPRAGLPGRVEPDLKVAVEVDYAELDDLLQSWSGSAERTFTRGYLAFWPVSVGLQLQFLRQIEIGLRAYQLLIYKIRHDVVGIARDTVGALSLLKGEVIDSAPGGGTSSVEEGRVTAIYGVIAAALEIPALVSATIGVITAFQPEDPPPGDPPSRLSAFEDAETSDPGDNGRRRIGGATKEEIVRSALARLGELDELVRDEARDIKAAIEEVTRFSLNEGRAWLVLAPPPAIAGYRGGVGLTGYFEPMEPLRHFPAEGRLDADLVNLNEAARVVLPAMAYGYESARLTLTAVSDGIGYVYSGSDLFSMDSLVSLCGRLSAILRHTRDNLLTAGDWLADVARRYAEADGYCAEMLNNTIGGGRFDDPPTYEGYEDRVLGRDTPSPPHLFLTVP